MINPLRQEWIRGAHTKEEWDEVMKVIVLRGEH